MSTGPDWARLEAAVTRATEKLRNAATQNETLRAEVARLEGDLATAREAAADAENRASEAAARTAEIAGAAAADGGAVTTLTPHPRTEEVRTRLARLEAEIESLLAASHG